ncbi:MAG: hypothetical protein WCU88_07955 [Elusimicrobiota bacterium]|jgi:hypothetical protein
MSRNLNLRAFCLILAISLATYSQAHAVTGYQTLLGEKDCRDMREALQDPKPNWEKIMRIYWGTHDMYDPSLAKLIVHAGPSGEVRQALMLDGSDKKEYLQGERFLWITYLSEIKNSTPVLRADMTVMDESIGPAESVFRAVGKTFASLQSGNAADAANAAKDALSKKEGYVDVSTTIRVFRMSADESATAECQIHAGSARLSLKENTRNRLSIRPPEGERDIPGMDGHVRLIMRDISNGDPSRFGASLAIGSAFNTLDERNHVKVNFYVLGHLYLRRPTAFAKNKLDSFSVSLTAGPAVSNFPNDFVGGITLGHIWGTPVGVMGGARFGQMNTSAAGEAARKIWRLAPFVGFNMPL